ncbi:flippase-like domain-containing protein [Peptococcaceae bacterium]|nr:flippase-like domain-containing protein [Peptococcaceae bacterium]
MKSVLSKVNICWFFLLLISQVITLLLVAYRWHYLVCKLYNDISFFKTFSILLAGSFVESITPSSKLGGEAVKVYLFRKHTPLPYKKLTAILLLDKYFTLIPFGTICILFLVWSLFNMQLPYELYFVLPVLVLFIVILVRFYKPSEELKNNINEDSEMNNMLYNVEEKKDEKRESLLIRFLEKAKNMKSFIIYSVYYSRQIVNTKEQLMLFLLSLFIWILYPLKVYLIIIMLDINVDLFSTAAITYIAYLISIVPLLPGGLGSFEASMAVMFDKANASFAEGVSVALLSRLVTYWFPLFLSALATIYITYGYNCLKGDFRTKFK